MSTKATIHRGYVRTNDGDFLVQIPDPNARAGFVLGEARGEWSQTWDGGHGRATSWAAISRDEVPTEVRAEMEWMLDD